MAGEKYRTEAELCASWQVCPNAWIPTYSQLTLSLWCETLWADTACRSSSPRKGTQGGPKQQLHPSPARRSTTFSWGCFQAQGRLKISGITGEPPPSPTGHSAAARVCERLGKCQAQSVPKQKPQSLSLMKTPRLGRIQMGGMPSTLHCGLSSCPLSAPLSLPLLRVLKSVSMCACI